MPKGIVHWWTPVLVLAGILVALAVTLTPKPMRSQETSMTPVRTDINLNPLSPEEKRVIVDKGTEMPFTGEYTNHKGVGTYTCKWCDAELYRSADKFDSHCGWPSFDDEIPGAVKRSLDADGRRVEITCARCGGHLGHVFEGEGFTKKDVRHCVNSISLNFIPASAASSEQTVKTKKAYFAGGCFWGVEHLLENQKGVLNVRSGYMGGHVANPTYEQVCSKKTGHAETVEVEFDPSLIDFETLARLFFEIHDPTQMNRQGPDIGSQYRSAVFYVDEEQRATTNKLIAILKEKGYDVVTEVTKADTFWPAEDYHQDYYANKGTEPYCHFHTKRF